MKYYDLQGKEMSKETFLKHYSEEYFLPEKGVQSAVRCNKTSYYIESKIMNIKAMGIRSYTDLAKVVAWKIGKIKQEESQQNQKFVYASDWKSCESENPIRYGYILDLKSFYDKLAKSIERLEELSVSDPQRCLNELAPIAPKGIGTVVLITMLWFLSKGQRPIYDRFVMTALYAITNDFNPYKFETRNPLPSIPQKKSKSFGSIFSKGFYHEYISLLESTELDYKNERNVDRALWVYGHLFNNNGKTC